MTRYCHPEEHAETMIINTRTFSVDRLLLVTWNQSDHAVGGTLSEAAEWRLPIEAGGTGEPK